MKILFDNAAERAEITSAHESANYPPSNLIHQFLRLRWQEDWYAPESIITITFDSPEDINCLFLGYMNVTGVLVYTDGGAVAHAQMVDTEGTLPLAEQIVTSDGDFVGILPSVSGTESIYFDSIQESVNTLYVYVWGESSNIYLGGLGTGVAYAMPDPVTGSAEGFQDNSSVAASPYGQSLQNYITPLFSDNFSFAGISRDIRDEIMTKYRAAGVGGKMWVDRFDEDHSLRQPMYAQLVSAPESSRDGNVYDFSLNFMEAR